jgi:hypothetical protein
MVAKYLLVIIFVFAAVSCSEETPKKIPRVVNDPEKVSEIAPISKNSFRPQLDILFVIDDSGSMASHQKNLAQNISKFADAIVRTKFLDYHVGVINSTATGYSWSSKPCCGALVGSPRYVDRATPNGIQVLAANLIVGTSGDAIEKFFDPVYLAFTEPNLSGHNFGFYRQGASLALIFITDTEDQSSMFTARSIHSFLLTLKGSAEKLFVAAAHIPDNQIKTCSGETSDIQNKSGLTDLFQLTQATTFSLCDNFGEKLADIGAKIASRAQTMYLSQVPVQGTIKITMDGEELPSDGKFGWTYNASNNSIEFGAGIDWDSYPEGVYPQVNFEVIEMKP